jgi:hypothetical protein
MSDSPISRKNLVLGALAVVLLAGAAYLIFFRAPAVDPRAQAAQEQADRVTEAIERAGGGVKDVPPPKVNRRGAIGIQEGK